MLRRIYRFVAGGAALEGGFHHPEPGSSGTAPGRVSGEAPGLDYVIQFIDIVGANCYNERKRIPDPKV